MSYTPISEKYLHSSAPTEKTDDAYVWVVNELYQFLLRHPLVAKTIYETKNRDEYMELICSFVRDVPNRLYDTEFRHDWTLGGENNGFMNALRIAYRQIPPSVHALLELVSIEN